MEQTYTIIGFNRVSGPPEQFHIDHRIFNAATFCSSFIGLAHLMANAMGGQSSLPLQALFLVFTITSMSLYYKSRLHRVRSQQLRLVYLAITLTALLVGLAQSGGLLGVVPYYYVLTYMIYLTMFRLRYHILLSLGMFGLITATALLQYSRPHWFGGLAATPAQIVGAWATVVLTMFFSLGLINYLHLNYSLEKRKVLAVNRKLAESQAEAQKAMEEAIQASKAKAEFLSTMSHEIRTPMNAVIGMTHLLLQDNPSEEQMENLSTLKFSAENLLALINDILDFSKIEAGKIALENIDFSLKELVRSVKEALSLRANDKGVEVRTLMGDDVPTHVVGDPTRLTQILNNLVGNAVKFTNEGSVTLKVECLDKTAHKDRLRFSVIDTGIGIAPDQHERIFEKFSQATATTTREFGGTGLGLSITKKLLELMGTNIKLESELGKGTTFCFDLEMGVAVADKTKALATKDHEIFSSLKGLNVLVVDDNKTNILIAKKFLHKWEINVESAADGAQACELVAKHHFDLVLMDLQMPVMDGLTATSHIRAMAGSKSLVPIIALTASAMNEEKQAIFDAGMNDFVSKPFNPADLYRKIRAHTQAKTLAA
ncbi:MAG: response regulator [Bacteroidetes bacterium]|jgi:signal transduction histidine kinase/CheY-like chemotaxis protein|nr:response regulator [Bacteroidota bacterium]